MIIPQQLIGLPLLQMHFFPLITPRMILIVCTI